MPRPGFVLEVDERTPPLLVHQGEGFRLQRSPSGRAWCTRRTRCPGIKDVNAAIRHALLNPIDAEAAPGAPDARHEAHDRDRRHLAAACRR